MENLTAFENLTERELEVATVAYKLALMRTAVVYPKSSIRGLGLNYYINLILHGETVQPEFAVRVQIERLLSSQELLEIAEEEYAEVTA